MKKIIFLTYIFLIFNFTYSEEIKLKTKEDVEIEKMEEQIKNLQNKIENTKKLKSAKDNKKFKSRLSFKWWWGKRLCPSWSFKSS